MNKKDVQQSTNEAKESIRETSAYNELNVTQNLENTDSSEIDNLETYDDTINSNVDENDPIAVSNDHLNENSLNERPTFTRTYDKNESDEIPAIDAGKFDGEVGI